MSLLIEGDKYRNNKIMWHVVQISKVLQVMLKRHGTLVTRVLDPPERV